MMCSHHKDAERPRLFFNEDVLHILFGKCHKIIKRHFSDYLTSVEQGLWGHISTFANDRHATYGFIKAKNFFQ